MNDDSVLTMLAKKSAKPSSPEVSVSDSAIMSFYLRAEEKRAAADAALTVLTAGVADERAEHKSQIAALEARLIEANSALSIARANTAALEGRQSVVVTTTDNTAIEALRAENADLRVECATYKGRVQEMERAAQIAQSRIALLETEDVTEAVTESEPEAETPMNYDIEVIRGGDDKIRSLRVRCTE